MKKTFLSKITAIVMSMLMLFSLCACNENAPQASIYPKNGEKKIITTTRDIYLPTGQSDSFNVAYYENEEEVLLIEIEYAVTELLSNFVLARTGNTLSYEEDSTQVLLTRDNESYCELDFVKDTVYFDDFDSFCSAGHNATPHDMLALPYANEEGQKEYFERRDSFYTPGYAIELELAERNIPLDIYDGMKYIPLQTFNDIFLCPFGCNIAYNGENLFVLVGNVIADEVTDLYYGKEASQRSTALTEFNYNELCLFLDLYYGLQNEHGFTDGFDYYLDNIGLKNEFLKPDATNGFNALGTLTLGYIADLHSVVTSASPYVGASNPSGGSNFKKSPAVIDYINARNTYAATRGTVEPYEKVGDTAFVTLDEFSFERSGNYEQDLAQPIADTIGIIAAVHDKIKNDSEIKNVVLDLSCNGGGAVDSAIYTIAWMLGYCDFSSVDSATGSKSTITYKADVNFNRVFDENDNISDLNLYCLISPVSFSCGNLVPALLKASGKVTIVGKSSTGGGCVVRHGVTADGTLFDISSPKQLATVKNGTYYSVDQGVEPDIPLTKIENFYNRGQLVQYLNAIK